MRTFKEHSDYLNEWGGEAITKNVDDFRQWVISDNKDKKSENHTTPKKDDPWDDAKRDASNSKHTVLKTNKNNAEELSQSNDTPIENQKESKPKEHKELTMSEFRGKGGDGWWYLILTPDIAKSVSNIFIDNDAILTSKPVKSKFLVGTKYILRPVEDEKVSPNKYRTVYLVLDNVDKDKDKKPDFAFLIFDGKKSFDTARNTLLLNLTDTLLDNPDKTAQILKFGQPSPESITSNPRLYQSFSDINPRFIPKEHKLAINALLGELKDNLSLDESNEEYIVEASGYLINDIVGAAVPKVFKGLKLGVKGIIAMIRANRKPKKLPLRNSRGLLQFTTRDKLFNCTYGSYVATNAGCAQSLVQYQEVKDSGMIGGAIATKIMSAKQVFTVGRYQPFFTTNDNEQTQEDIDEFIKSYDLKEPFHINEMTVWKTSNGGNILCISIQENYTPDKPSDDSIQSAQVISTNEEMNLKFFVGCDNKGEVFFNDTYKMSLKQYLMSTKNANSSTLKKQGEMINQSVNDFKNAIGSQDGGQVLYRRRFNDDTDFNSVFGKFKNIKDNDPSIVISQKEFDDGTNHGNKIDLKNGGQINFYKEKSVGREYIVLTQKASEFFRDNNIDDLEKYKKETV